MGPVNPPEKKLLIVDDDEGFTELVVEYFKAGGYDPRASSNLEGAIDLFRQHKPKVVLLDFNMPMVTGEKFLPILQGMDPSVRVIIVTGCLEEEVRHKFKDLKYFSFFQKGGLSLEKMRQKVDEAISL